MLARRQIDAAIRAALGRSRAVVLNGPRQSGKSTIAQTFVSRDSPNYFELENPLQAARLAQPALESAREFARFGIAQRVEGQALRRAPGRGLQVARDA